MEQEFIAFSESTDSEYQSRSRSGSISASSPFQLSASLIDTMRKDPAFETSFEKAVQEAVEKRIEVEFADDLAKSQQKANEQGYQAGLEKLNEEIESLTLTLNKICDSILHEKEKILRSHEKVWLSALRHILKGFGIRGSLTPLVALKDWINSAIDRFSEQGKISVLVSDSDYSVLSKHIKSEKFEFLKEDTLGTGEVIVECRGDSIFFSPQEQWEKLEQILKTDDHA